MYFMNCGYIKYIIAISIFYYRCFVQFCTNSEGLLFYEFQIEP